MSRTIVKSQSFEAVWPQGTRDPAGTIEDAEGGVALHTPAVQTAMPLASFEHPAAAASAGVVGLDYFGDVPSEAAGQTADVRMMRSRTT